jgi:hypothetical protein
MTDHPNKPRDLTIKEAVARIRAGKPVTWVTARDGDETYDVALDYPDHRDNQNDN